VAYDTHLADRVREQLANEEGMTEQGMFGDLAFLLHGNLAVAVSGQGGLLVRVPRQQEGQVLSRPHTEPMVMGGRARPGWVRVSLEGVKSTKQLTGWVKLGVASAHALPPKGAPAARPGAARPGAGGPRARALADKGAVAEFDAGALWRALDAQRRTGGLSWTGVATEMWELSAELNGRRHDHPISASTMANMSKRGDVGCQHALFMLRWLGHPPDRFLRANGARVVEEPLPAAGPDRRLRWDLKRLYAALDAERRERQLTWVNLAQELRCTPSQLTGIRTARFGMSMSVAMRVVQWLGRPAADFVYAAEW
jgi:TfoX N-terminal domain